MNDPKLLFVGTMGAGKTTAIASISDIAPIATDVANTDFSESSKTETTVALDYGEVSLDDGSRLRLYGTPGQQRFDFMWTMLAADALGVILLVDNSRADPLADLETYLQAFAAPIASGRLVIGVGRMDVSPRPNLESYVDHLEQTDLLVPVLAVDVRQRDDVLLLLETLFRQIECLGSEADEVGGNADWSQWVASAREAQT